MRKSGRPTPKRRAAGSRRPGAQAPEVHELCAVPDEMTGLALRAFLAEAGVQAWFKVQQASFYSTALNPKGAWGKIMVAKAQAARAGKLLADFRRTFDKR